MQKEKRNVCTLSAKFCGVFAVIFFLSIQFVGFVHADPTYFALPKQALGNASFSVALKQPLEWKDGADTYSLTFFGVQNSRALVFINVSGKMFRFTLALDKPLNLDVTGDKQPDGSITLVKLEDSKAEFKMASFAEQANVPSSVSFSGSENTVKLNNWVFFGGIAVVVILIVVVGWLIFRKRKSAFASP